MSNFAVNFARNLYHPNPEVNDIIKKGRQKKIDINQMISSIEQILGSRGHWQTHELIVKYHPNRKIGFDDFIMSYLELPLLITHSSATAERNKKKYNDMIEQRLAYEKNQGEDCTTYSHAQVRRYVTKEIFRNVIFFSEDKENFFHPNFVEADDDDDEEPQSVTICNILLACLNRKSLSIKSKVNWWITYRKTIYDCVINLRGKTIHAMSANFSKMYQKYKNDPQMNESFAKFLDICDDDDEFIGESFLDTDVDKDAYKTFIDLAFSAFYPKEEFFKHMKHSVLSKVITATEEAFALLCVENNYKRWKWMASPEAENDALKVMMPHPRYQSEVKPRKDKKNSAGRWTEDGLKRMNELIAMVTERRSQRCSFEDDLKKMYVGNISAEELRTDWIESINSKNKRLKRESHVVVKNCLKYGGHKDP